MSFGVNKLTTLYFPLYGPLQLYTLKIDSVLLLDKYASQT